MPRPFAELVDLKRIEALLTSFYDLTELPSAITDSEGTIIMGVGWRRICTDFHRKHPESAARCNESDCLLSRLAGKDMRVTSNQCLNGLIDVAVPITIKGEQVANLFMGQFAPPDMERDFYVQQAERYGFDTTAYLGALDEIIPFDREKVNKEITFLSNLAGLIGEMCLDQMKLREFATELENKVEERTVQLKNEVEIRKQAEKATRRTLSEFETIFNNSSVGICYLKNGRIIHRANKRFAAMLGYTELELAGRNTRFLYPDDASYEQAGKIYRALQGKTGFMQCEQQYLRKNGERFWCSLYGKAVDSGVVEDGVIWVAIDITEHKEFEMLREDVDMIMRHDLKGPLNGIIGLTKSLQRADNLNQDQNEVLEMIIDAGYMISNQINRSLEIYKLETGRYALTPAPVDIRALIELVVRDLARKARDGCVTLQVAVDAELDAKTEPLLVQADEMLSYTMLSNLVDNAVEATAPGEKITIRLGLDAHAQFCSISVHNPSEVPQEIRTKFFDKYITSGKPYGTGLGTYSAKMMAEAQRGNIRMETSARGGTSVRVSLPV